MHRHRRAEGRGGFGLLITVVLFLVMLGLLGAGVFGMARGTGEQGAASTRRALERAAVLCYATEGFYPPSLEYISVHYGVEADTNQYAVRYEIQGANVMPSIQVIVRGS